MMPEEVCHYTRAKTALKILSTRKLRISQFKFTDDPRESRERNAAIIWVTHQEDGIKKGYSSLSSNPTQDTTTQRIQREANQIALEEWKVLCVTLHRPPNQFRSIQDEVYNHSIRPGYARPRMWAQYAENHTGVCFVFDAMKLNEIIHKNLDALCRILQGRVTYNYKRLVHNTIPVKNQTENADEEHLIEELRAYYIAHFKETFLIKHPDWRDEKEYRWILHSSQKSHLFVPIEDAVKDIFVGVDFPKTCLPRLTKYCKELKISVGRMEWDDGIALSRFGSIYKPQ